MVNRLWWNMSKNAAPIVDVDAHKTPSLVTPSIGWIGRSCWGNLPAISGNDCNIWLLRGERFDVLVDCGRVNNLAVYDRNIRHLGGDPRRVKEIWITHTHWDHSGAAAAWQKRSGVTVRMAEVGAKFIRRGDLRLVGCAMEPSYRFPVPAKIVGIKAGSTLRCPPWEFQVVPLPGHTPDCIAFRGRVDGLDVMFTGDAIIGDQRDTRGCVGWLGGLWLSNILVYEQTLLTALKHPPQLMLPGHGQPAFARAAERSIRNCLWRIRKLLSIQNLGSTLPVYCAQPR